MTRGAGGGVEVAGGLVGEEDAGPMAEGAGQRHALLLASRELGRVVVAAAAEADPVQQLVRPLLGLQPAQLQRHLDVLARGEGRDELERLEHEADLLAAEAGPLVFAQRAELLAVEPDAAGGGPVEPGEQAEQRALAAAGRARGWPRTIRPARRA